ncbi:hypothetical protein E1I69_05575 [Bacillus timonensis]|uniref:Uncharacterized protein n=1 Tax=Bacillus timonensis TaxID=1033734 RepID=A0A4S3PVV9_9BACI|nr:hypothetical protein E1I69_05575 [Bacillus timonensis]
MRLARTVSDIRGEKQISEEAIWEAMSLSRSQENNRVERIKQGVREW